MKTPIILQILFVQDPTESVEEIKELSPEEIYYNAERERDEVEELYVTSLERKLKSKNDELKALSTLMVNGHLDFYRNQINNIIKI